jgi:tetratricopeptide (TPR) repeat protein
LIPFVAALALAAASPACPADTSPGALLCRAVEAVDAKQYAEAGGAFEAAASASPPTEEKTLRMWAAAGNAWILANNAGRAAAALDKALATPGLDPAQVGFAELDRGRAAEMQNDLKTARKFADRAKAHNADDPFTWYFGAALSLRENDVAAAQAAIGQALKLAPDSAEIQFEAGHVAAAAGDKAKARAYWEEAARLDPGGPFAKDAADAIRLLEPAAPAPTSGK